MEKRGETHTHKKHNTGLIKIITTTNRSSARRDRWRKRRKIHKQKKPHINKKNHTRQVIHKKRCVEQEEKITPP